MRNQVYFGKVTGSLLANFEGILIQNNGKANVTRDVEISIFVQRHCRSAYAFTRFCSIAKSNDEYRPNISHYKQQYNWKEIQHRSVTNVLYLKQKNAFLSALEVYLRCFFCFFSIKL